MKSFRQEGSPARRMALGLFGLILLGVACGVLFREPVSSMGEALVERFGAWGIVACTLVTDTSPLPLTSEPIVLLALGAGLPYTKIMLLMSATSHACGPLGHTMGRLLGMVPGMRQRLEARFPDAFDFMHRKGVTGVWLAALLPIPFALTTWVAGIAGVSFWGTVLASSGRWIKTSIAVLLLSGGWAMGGN
jgi:membrane protein YqaA with SNARE-associated domain